MVTNVGRRAARIPIQKKTRPAMVMHRYRRAGRRDTDFENANELVFKNNFVSVRRGLHSIVAVGKTRFVLPVEIKASGKQLWVLTSEGLGYLNLNPHVSRNAVPPLVQIETFM